MNKGMVYKTVYKKGNAEIVEKKSRFIASVSPVTTEEEAIAFVNSVKAQYRDARHNVYAYVVSENNISRFTDDGEPSGTAGAPVLDVLLKEGLTDAAIVVTRYFGGTLLGTGGLVRAYGKAAKDGVLDAKICEKIYCHELSLHSPYDLHGKIKYIVDNGDYIEGATEYGADVEMTVFVKYDLLDKFLKEINDATNASITPQIVGEMYIDKIISE
ncbi:MAG: YigZ family protein [Clostridia bacterium]|nr:YigZ family protein [Clostridia bacterium]